MSVPRLGLGTWQLTGEEGVEAMKRALELGYRHIDTAQLYENEALVATALEESEVSRENVFIATKINHIEIPAATRDEVFEATHESLERLGLDTIDLLYVHWPAGNYDPAVTLPAFEELRERGLIDHIGLSNFTPALLEDALEHLDAPLTAHQVEMHPLFQQETLHEYARRDGHSLVAYSPLSNGEVFDVPVLREIAEKYGVSVAQISLSWLLHKEQIAAVPKASSEAHLRENLRSTTFELDDEDVERIDSLDREERFIDPDGAPWSE